MPPIKTEHDMTDAFPRKKYNGLHWRLLRVWLFARIVWREADENYRLPWRTAWDVAKIVWSENDAR